MDTESLGDFERSVRPARFVSIQHGRRAVATQGQGAYRVVCVSSVSQSLGLRAGGVPQRRQRIVHAGTRRRLGAAAGLLSVPRAICLGGLAMRRRDVSGCGRKTGLVSVRLALLPEQKTHGGGSAEGATVVEWAPSAVQGRIRSADDDGQGRVLAGCTGTSCAGAGLANYCGASQALTGIRAGQRARQRWCAGGRKRGSGAQAELLWGGEGHWRGSARALF